MTDDEYKVKYGWFDEDAHNGIKSTERVRKFAEVLTPRWVAEKMIDLIPGASEIESTVFEPCCGEGAFITCVLRRKLALAKTYAQKLRACQTCYGIDIQYDNVLICREKLIKIAMKNGVKWRDAAFVFARNIIHGDMLFFPMIARIYDWETDTWTTLEEIGKEEQSQTQSGQQMTFVF